MFAELIRKKLKLSKNVSSADKRKNEKIQEKLLNRKKNSSNSQKPAEMRTKVLFNSRVAKRSKKWQKKSRKTNST